MPRPLHEWNEDDVLALPPGESDSFERKGSKLLDLREADVKEGRVLDELAKQLSAFANTGGGQIIYGVTDAGDIDNGGVSLSVKAKQPTEEWLADVIPILTDYEIIGCNVYVVLPKADDSKIHSGKAIYVVDVPDSERAPHQSKRDSIYYIRLGSRSVPASHRIIEDIRTRRRHPSVELQPTRLRVVSVPPFEVLDPQTWEGQFSVDWQFKVKNSGRVMARNTCLHLKSNFEVAFTGLGPMVNVRSDSNTEIFLDFRDPIYPGMEIGFNPAAFVFGGYGSVRSAAPFGGPWYLGSQRLALPACRLDLELFADDAIPNQSNVTMEQLRFEQEAKSAIERSHRNAMITDAFPSLRL